MAEVAREGLRSFDLVVSCSWAVSSLHSDIAKSESKGSVAAAFRFESTPEFQSFRGPLPLPQQARVHWLRTSQSSWASGTFNPSLILS